MKEKATEAEKASIRNQRIVETSAMLGLAVAFMALSVLHLFKETRANRVDPNTGIVTYTNKYECLLGTIHEDYSAYSSTRSQREWQGYADVILDHFMEFILFAALAGFVIYKGRTRKENTKPAT